MEYEHLKRSRIASAVSAGVYADALLQSAVNGRQVSFASLMFGGAFLTYGGFELLMDRRQETKETQEIVFHAEVTSIAHFAAGARLAFNRVFDSMDLPPNSMAISPHASVSFVEAPDREPDAFPFILKEETHLGKKSNLEKVVKSLFPEEIPSEIVVFPFDMEVWDDLAKGSREIEKGESWTTFEQIVNGKFVYVWVVDMYKLGELVKKSPPEQPTQGYYL